jgi:hypothetical protein
MEEEKLLFKDIPCGLFRWHEQVYTKISDTQAAMITSGKIKDFDPEEEVQNW